jgi:imidazolonepropionase-like amidohydrolase
MTGGQAVGRSGGQRSAQRRSLTARPRVRLSAAVVVLFAACKPPGEGVIALEGATLIDGTGRAPIGDALLLVKQGHIEAVARVNEIEIPRGAVRISLIGKTVIPGLIDAHAHVERWAIPRYLAWGVTTVRDLHSDSAFALKNDLNLGSVLGPRMFTAGAMIDGAPPTYAGATAANTGADARRAVDQRAITGADYVKIYTKITPELLRPLMDEAATLQLPVAAHLGKTDALTAARAGVTRLEHMAGVVQAAVPDPAALFRAHDQFLRGWTLEEAGWGSLDSATVARTARALAQTGVAIVPTLVLHDMLSRLDVPTLLMRPEMADVPAAAARVRDVAGLRRRAGWGGAEFAAFRRARARQDQFVREFRRAGGLIAAGSDAANALLVPGASLHEELSLLVAAGLTPLDAVAAATRQAAQVLRADSLGQLAPGKVADLVVLNRNPAADVAATRDIAWVMIRGRIVHPDSLRRTWSR